MPINLAYCLRHVKQQLDLVVFLVPTDCFYEDTGVDDHSKVPPNVAHVATGCVFFRERLGVGIQAGKER